MKRYRTELLVIGSVALAATGQTLIKLGLTGAAPWTDVAVHWPLPLPNGLLGGLAVYGLGTLLWFAAVAQRSISYLYPLAAINYVLMGLIGHFLLHEPMGALRWAGILTMAAGIALLSQTSREAAL